MVQYASTTLDASFAAVAVVTRRRVLEQLSRGDASISDLAKRFDLTLTGMKKHVGVLEHARLVTTRKQGRVRTCSLGPRRLQDVAAWLERYRQLWDARFDALENVVEQLQREEQAHERPRKGGKSEPTR
jgi:DNA-binding transcriptional ArsR family regulator